MGKVTIGTGKLSVVLDDGAARLVERALRTAAPTVTRRIEEETGKVFASALHDWPIKTGKSKRALDQGIRVPNATTVEGFIRNDVPYAFYIKGMKQRGKSTWVELVRKPMQAAAKVVADELGPDLRRAMGG